MYASPQIMAAQMEHFRYRNVQIFKSQSLGVGSYGAVYRARCDQLPCAAKLLHPILANPGAPRNQQRFEQECQFLSGIRHPHIVQYLGTCRDPESGLPVLLMELMDDSLTHFLEDSREPLPYHLEVNLCHDVALALAYLHSNGIIHRDLSSNNVLLIAGSRAKVTDFGMSKLVDAAPQMTPLTQCPGTAAYMSPEAMREPPVYTDKLDCFAHGVMAIQIMTREFPNPSPSSHLVNDPRSPTGTMLMPVLEPERRKLHIDRIDPTHPLLPIAVQCLSYNEKDRPSAQQLCHQLATLKEAPWYVRSVQRAQERGKREERSFANTGDKDSRIAELQRHVAVCEWEIRELQEQLHKKDVAAVASQQDIQRLTQNNKQLTLKKIDQLSHHEQCPRDDHQFSQDIKKLTQEIRQLRQEKNDEIEGRDRQLRDNERMFAELQQTLVQKEKRIKELEETISAREIEVQKGPKVKQQQKRLEASHTAVNTIKLNWTPPTKALCGMYRGSAAVDGSMAYFNHYCTKIVYGYDLRKDEWLQLPDCPEMRFTLAVVKGLLTAVGGQQSGKPTNTLLSLSEDYVWSKIFPPMPTKRCWSAVVCTEGLLVVAGGEGNNGDTLTTVEVMDANGPQWHKASSLPHPLYLASATICGENLYLLGDSGMCPTKSAFTCSLDTLLQSCQRLSLGARLGKAFSLDSKDVSTVWHTVADAPVTLSTCTTLRGQLLAIGGRDSDGKPTTAIHKYDPVKNSWTVISHMEIPRTRSLVAVLPGDKLMVVNDTIESASIL